MPTHFPDWRLGEANKFLCSKEMVPNLHGEKNRYFETQWKGQLKIILNEVVPAKKNISLALEDIYNHIAN